MYVICLKTLVGVDCHEDVEVVPMILVGGEVIVVEAAAVTYFLLLLKLLEPKRFNSMMRACVYECGNREMGFGTDIYIDDCFKNLKLNIPRAGLHNSY